MASPVAVHLPAQPGPGWTTELRELEVQAVEGASLILPEAWVGDAAGENLLDAGMPGGDRLVFAPAAGGGPLSSPPARRGAAAFGLVNVAYHVQHGLRHLSGLLGRPLPPLPVRVGMHQDGARGWGGGHYRLPADNYSELPEVGAVAATGEIHLGRGRTYVSTRDGRYFHAPTHNPAIVYHELGHHLCRHTADFRLNRLRKPQSQTNRKTAVDEGTSDYLTAVLLGTPDIYGWHRAELAEDDQRRRQLHPRWTMAAFRGGHTADPHADGTVFASALWSARMAVAAADDDPQVFDRLLVVALDEIGSDPAALCEEDLRSRRQFARMLELLLTAPVAGADPIRVAVQDAFARHGIRVGRSNAQLRDDCRTTLKTAS